MYRRKLFFLCRLLFERLRRNSSHLSLPQLCVGSFEKLSIVPVLFDFKQSKLRGKSANGTVTFGERRRNSRRRFKVQLNDSHSVYKRYVCQSASNRVVLHNARPYFACLIQFVKAARANHSLTVTITSVAYVCNSEDACIANNNRVQYTKSILNEHLSDSV